MARNDLEIPCRDEARLADHDQTRWVHGAGSYGIPENNSSVASGCGDTLSGLLCVE